jgi:hypothetical protein
MSWIRLNDGWIRPSSKAPNPLTASIFFLLDNDVLTMVGQYLDKLKMESSRKFFLEQGRVYWGQYGARRTYFSENVIRQIRALYPGFIMYIIDSPNPVTDDVVHALPLTTRKDPRWCPYTPTPSGVSVINHVFQEPPLTFMEGAGIYDVGRQRLRGRLWPSYFNTTYRTNSGRTLGERFLTNTADLKYADGSGGGLEDYVSDYAILDEMQREFREVSDILEEKGDHEWYESIEELNEDKGIRVSKEIEY